MASTDRIALLRGINVTGRNRVPMADLRALCGELGYGAVRSAIQSGNLVFESRKGPARLEQELERAVEERFGVSVPVLVRVGDAWPELLAANPFPDESEREPKLVALALSKKTPRADAVEGLRERAAAGERVELAGGALWLHFPAGIARSKLTPARLDRLAGSPVTARNWRTVLKIEELRAGG